MGGRGSVLGLVIGVVFSLAGLGALLAFGVGMGLLPTFGVLLAFYGLVIYGFLHYRVVRQEELRQVLTLAAEAKAPLAGAVWAYAEDRPRSWFRVICEAALTNLVAIGSYWSWHQASRFGRKAANLAYDLERGTPLSLALRRTPGLASSETLLAAAVGESTGDLVRPLTHLSQTTLGPTVIEALARLVYPAMILLVQSGVIVFLLIAIVPKFEAIANDFRVRLPYFSLLCLSLGKWFVRYGSPMISLTCFSLLWIVPLLIASPGFRWRFPVVSWIERRFSQGRLLKMLGMLLAAGKTAPQALTLLGEEDYLGQAVQTRIAKVRAAVMAGKPLAEELAGNGLMPKSMVPLLHAAERARNLPWAFEEAGEALVRRAKSNLQRVSSAFAPIAIMILGLVTAAVSLSLFLTFIAIMTKVS